MLVLGQGLQFSLLTVYVCSEPELLALKLPITLVLVGLVTAGTVSLAINSTVRILFPFVMIAPIIIYYIGNFSISRGNHWIFLKNMA